MQAGSRIRAKRCLMTAQMILWAVVFYKISSNLLNAKMQAGSRIRANRRLMTAKMVRRAVANKEISLIDLRQEKRRAVILGQYGGR